MEFMQMIVAVLQPDEWVNFDEIVKHYLTALHSKNPAAQEYTEEMLRQDMAMGFILGVCGYASFVTPILQDPKAPYWTLMKSILARWEKAMIVFKVNEVMQAIAKQGKLI